jgi:hypothetical protein
MLGSEVSAKFGYCESYCMPRDLITSDTTIRNIKPGDQRKRISDGEGLYLLLFVKGGSHGWRFDYSIHGLSLGTYPDTGLKLAREKAAAARALVAAGTAGPRCPLP